MDSSKKYISARIPNLIYLSLKKTAKERKVTFTDIVVEALEQYVGANIPGLCPKCHTQNDPDAKFCSQCSAPLSPDSQHIGFQSVAEPKVSINLQAFENLESLEKYIKKVKNEVGEIDDHLVTLEKLKQDIEKEIKKTPPIHYSN